MEVTITAKVSYDVSDYDNLVNELHHITDKEKDTRINIIPTIDLKQNPTVSFGFDLPGEPLAIDFSLNRDQVIYLKNYFDAWLKNNPSKRK